MKGKDCISWMHFHLKGYALRMRACGSGYLEGWGRKIRQENGLSPEIGG